MKKQSLEEKRQHPAATQVWSEEEISHFRNFVSQNISFLKENIQRNRGKQFRTVKKQNFFKNMSVFLGGTKTPK